MIAAIFTNILQIQKLSLRNVNVYNAKQPENCQEKIKIKIILFLTPMCSPQYLPAFLVFTEKLSSLSIRKYHKSQRKQQFSLADTVRYQFSYRCLTDYFFQLFPLIFSANWTPCISMGPLVETVFSWREPFVIKQQSPRFSCLVVVFIYSFMRHLCQVF